jgi:catechol 2,3-dioxygenase-like lactoylglutathione lyase family enzyme
VLITGLDHVQLAAPRGCEEQARSFYAGVLGLAELPKPQALRARGGVWFAVGEQQLHVGVEEPFAPARKAHAALRVTACGLDDLAARVRAAGAPVDWDDALATRRFFTADPFGNRLELLAVARRS